jgi:hypothetical protein
MVRLLKVPRYFLCCFKVEYIQLLSRHYVLVLLAVYNRCSFNGRDNLRLLLLGKMSQLSATDI